VKTDIRSPAMQSAKHQSGTVLIVVIMLLLLASVLTFFTLNVGVFEQQTSGNDLKSKLVAEVADAGLSQGAEYIKQNYAALADTSKWTLCTASDTSFPCGSAPPSRRATMYYWSGGGAASTFANPITSWNTAKMLPIAIANALTGTTSSTAGNIGFGVQYAVGAVMCHVAKKATKSAPTTCTDPGSGNATSISIVTLVSTAAIPSENARSTVSESIGSFTNIGNLPASPPIVASGNINLVGTIQIVTNPNAGGTGVPVSIWTPKSLNGNGTGNSCYANEFYSSGTVTWDPATPNFPLCDSCSCNGSLSSAHGNTVSNGIDSLNGDDNSATGGNGPVHVDADPTKTEFPCDLFQQVFGVSAWQDLLPNPNATGGVGDGFCETHIMTTYTDPNGTGNIVTMGVDEAYLYTYAQYIVADSTRTYTCASGCSGTVTAASLRSISSSTAVGVDQTVAKNAGLVWCQDGSMCAHGTAAAPVLMVFDGSGPDLTNSGDVYGMVFGRSKGYTTNGSATAVLDPATGGDATFTLHSNGTVYGAIVLQGTTGHLNGTSAVVYNKDILTNLTTGGSFTKFDGVAGSWTDRTSY
jgi:Tfp pilus assembly protein PilX